MRDSEETSFTRRMSAGSRAGVVARGGNDRPQWCGQWLRENEVTKAIRRPPSRMAVEAKFVQNRVRQGVGRGGVGRLDRGCWLVAVTVKSALCGPTPNMLWA